MPFDVDPSGPAQSVYTVAEVDALFAALPVGLDVEAVQDAVAALLQQGTGVTLSYDDTANTLTITGTAGGGGLDAEAVRDAIGVALVGVPPITVTVNDAGDTITISSTAYVKPAGGIPSTDLAASVNTSLGKADSAVQGSDSRLSDQRVPTDNSVGITKLTATGAKDGTTVLYGDNVFRVPPSGGGGLDAEGVQDTVAAMLVQGAGVTLLYNDAANTLTVSSTGVAGEIIPNGTTSAAVQAAVNAVGANGVVKLLPNTTYTCDQVVLPARNIHIAAEGATINSPTSGHYAFIQNAGHWSLTFRGGTFTGTGNGIQYSIAVSDTQFHDFAFSEIKFIMGSASTAISLTGCREGIITNCYFETCTGIHLQATVNPHIIGCQFKNCPIAIDAAGTGTSYDAGLYVTQATFLGCGYGVKIVGWDYFDVSDNMIDYCYHPVYAANSPSGVLRANYITQVGSTGGISPAVVEMSGCDHTKILECHIRPHTDLPAQSVSIKITNQPRTLIAHNTIDYWQKYGIQFVGSNAGTRIIGNYIRSVLPTTGPAAIFGANNSAESTFVTMGNLYSDAPANLNWTGHIDLGNYTGAG